MVVVEDWISEHYFTTEAKSGSFQSEVLKRRRLWDDAEDGSETTRSRFVKSRAALGSLLAETVSDDGTPEAAHDDVLALYASLREMLGYSPHEYQVTERDGVFRYNAPGVSTDPPLVVVEATAVAAHESLFDKGATTLLRPYPRDDGDDITSMPLLVSHLFLSETPPDFALVLAGRWLLVGERSRWAEGRYLAVDLQTVCERNDAKRGGEIDRALTCLSAESLAPDADGGVWWTEIIGASVKHTVGVSKDLREGVRLSIEIIADEVVARRSRIGLEPLAQDQAQPLAKQALRYLYRILFLLYAEASPEMAVLPVDAPEYEAGYSLGRLRELTLVEIADPRSERGTHLYDSLALLFRLVDGGHTSPKVVDPDGHASTDGLDFQPLRADLFKPGSISLIGEVKLGNAALQKVLRHLLLSKQSKKADRGFISYVELGINQLGAVYEGLMSYTGSFAATDLYEVAPGGDPSKGSWVVPIERAAGIAASDFVKVKDDVTDEMVPVVHERGSFVFRLSGRERQQSASYYTPEVLTRFTVGQALEELLDQNDATTRADEILKLTICEPALGSGAFAIEAVRQLAGEYLARRQRELGEKIPPEDYPRELQRVKASLALHQVYGVDLNATAVEFAEIALWLDTMAAGLQAPWFGLRLRRGNSLIGARRAVYARADVNSKAWLDTPPTDVPLTDIARRMNDDDARPTDAGGRIPHWLLPARGWGSTSDSKEAKQLDPDRCKRIGAWRRSVIGKPTKTQVDALVEIGHQAEELWTMAYRRLLVAEEQSQRSIPIWGHEEPPTPTAVTREQIEDSLADPDGAYQRLRRVMDAWCALWFWPLTGDEIQPPTMTQWIDACQQILGKDAKARRAASRGAATLAPDDVWQALADQEDLAIKGAGAAPITDVIESHPWLKVCERVAAEQGFFHWQLDFATVFGRGGFDLQVGNPPWVRPTLDMDALLAEGDPWWKLSAKPSEHERRLRLATAVHLPGLIGSTLAGVGDVGAQSSYVGSAMNFPILAGLQPDLYRCFMSQVWKHASSHGVSCLLHPDSHFTDEKASTLREQSYVQLRRHWQFVNELQLFTEVHHLVSYGVHTYGARRAHIAFDNASALYHPETVVRSYAHDGTGPEPGFKHEGHWDLRPHRARIQHVDDDALRTWHGVLEGPGVPVRQTRMVYTVNTAVAQTLAKLTQADRIGSLGLHFSAGWHEKNDRARGYFIQRWGAPPSEKEVILQGPHLHVNNPFYKAPNLTMKHNQDWSPVDLEALPSDAIPTTSYKPAGDRRKYDADYTHWDGSPARDHYRIAWRAMAANTGERTLIPALIPPGPAHIHGVHSAGTANGTSILIQTLAIASSLLGDLTIRCAPKAVIYGSSFSRLPLLAESALAPSLILRTLRLNCGSEAYGEIWMDRWDPVFATDTWTFSDREPARPNLGTSSRAWTPSTPLRNALLRRDAQIEIDVLVAIMAGITIEELCTVYRTQFAVLHDNDRGTGKNPSVFDKNGRRAPSTVLAAWRKKGDAITTAERTHTNASGHTYVYELPFRTYDREEDMRTAYAEFERRLREMS